MTAVVITGPSCSKFAAFAAALERGGLSMQNGGCQQVSTGYPALLDVIKFGADPDNYD
jgi:hypothetical protein